MGGPEDFGGYASWTRRRSLPDNHDWSTVRQSLTALLEAAKPQVSQPIIVITLKNYFGQVW